MTRRARALGVEVTAARIAGRAFAYEGPACYSHLPGHAAYGMTAWYVTTSLDDFGLGPYPDEESAQYAAEYARGLEAVVALDRDARRHRRHRAP